MRWAPFYDATGQCISAGYETPIPVDTWFLKLKLEYETTQARDEGLARTTVIANTLRMIFGVPVARELVLTIYSEHGSDEKYTLSDVGFASMFDNQSLNIFDDPPTENSTIRPLPAEASVLLDKAFSQRYSHERFILMWLAFEAIVHTFQIGASNGEKRKQYFQGHLGSNEANDEVKRLFDIRNGAFKEGRFERINFEEACWSLYSAIQLALLTQCPQRDAYLAGYEKYIRSTDSRSVYT